MKTVQSQSLDSSSSEPKLIHNLWCILYDGTTVYSGLTAEQVVEYTCVLLTQPGIDPDLLRGVRQIQ